MRTVAGVPSKKPLRPLSKRGPSKVTLFFSFKALQQNHHFLILIIENDIPKKSSENIIN